MGSILHSFSSFGYFTKQTQLCSVGKVHAGLIGIFVVKTLEEI